MTKCEGYDHKVTSSEWGMWGWATDWAQAGPIIDREGIWLEHHIAAKVHGAHKGDAVWFHKGPTPLIAAMRCYVASKLGDEVEIPEELMETNHGD